MRRLLLPSALAMATVLAAPAEAAGRREISPYIEVQQILDADLNQGGDVVTYTSIAAGIDAAVTQKRIEVGLSYRYERVIPWERGEGDYDIHSGLARVGYQLVPNTLNLNAGAIASRARSEIGGGGFNPFGGSREVNQVYGVYGGPSYQDRFGDLTVAANYQFGYVKVEDKFRLDDEPNFSRFDHSSSHMLNASIGMPSGALPFGWAISGGAQREDADILDQRYTGANIRGDVTVPVSPTVALTAGAGYEDIELSERRALRDGDGNVVLDRQGDPVADKNSPRLLTYDQDGLIWDVGVIWRPSRRTTAQLRGGRRYGDWAVTGSLDWQMNERSALHVGIYNGVDSFGRRLTGSLSALPTTFQVVRNPFTNDFNDCVFGGTPGTGACFGDDLQGISGANYKSRGINFLYTSQFGPWGMTLGGGYGQRKYLAPRFGGNFIIVRGVTDELWTLDGTLSREIGSEAGIGFTASGNWYDSGVPGGLDIFSARADASYYRNFGERLRAQASVGLSYYDQDTFDAWVAAQASLGARYSF